MPHAEAVVRQQRRRHIDVERQPNTHRECCVAQYVTAVVLSRLKTVEACYHTCQGHIRDRRCCPKPLHNWGSRQSDVSNMLRHTVATHTSLYALSTCHRTRPLQLGNAFPDWRRGVGTGGSAAESEAQETAQDVTVNPNGNIASASSTGSQDS